MALAVAENKGRGRRHGFAAGGVAELLIPPHKEPGWDVSKEVEGWGGGGIHLMKHQPVNMCNDLEVCI